MSSTDERAASGLRQACLGGGWSVGMVVALLAAAAIPAWPSFDVLPEWVPPALPPGSRIVTLVIAAGCLVGLLAVLRPRASAATPDDARCRAQRRAMNWWMAILIVYMLVVGAGSYAFTFGLGMGSTGRIVLVNALVFVAGPLVIAVASVVSFVRAGRG